MKPERLYLVALGTSGLAAIGSVALPPAQRGALAAAVVGGTLGASLGGCSLDTFLLSRPAGWVLGSGRRWLLTLLLGALALSAGVGVLVTAAAGVGSRRVAGAGAAALTLFNALGSLALRIDKFIFVYGVRAAGGTLLIIGYAGCYLRGDLDGAHWSYVWLGAQCASALSVAALVLRRATRLRNRPPGRPHPRADLVALGKLHVGICAHMLMFRLDQVLLARLAGAGPLGVYALAVSALEFAQAGAVVAAQRILATREAPPGPAAGGDLDSRPVVRAAVPIAVLAVFGLAALGLVVPAYHAAWPLGLILLPGTVAIAVDKVWSAGLLKRRGELATTVVALSTLAVAVPCYLGLIPFFGAAGAAIASSFVYAVQAAGTRFGLRRSPLTVRTA